MKVYALTTGVYSDHGIFAMFSTKERAIQARRMMNKSLSGLNRINSTIDEYELDLLGGNDNRRPYEVWLNADGSNSNFKVELESVALGKDFLNRGQFMKSGYLNKGDDFSQHRVFRTWCLANDADHARKIASERMALMKANNLEENHF